MKCVDVKIIVKELIQSISGQESENLYETMDSVQLMQLIILLEEKFNMEFQDKDLINSNFTSIDNIINLMSNYITIL